MVESDRHTHLHDSLAELTRTESRQGDGRRLNHRVLVLSTGLALVVAIVAALAFWNTTF
jgi:hypothetical protein